MKSLLEFIRQLEQVAAANDDEFSYSFIVVPSKIGRGFTLRIGFIVKEEADGHEILSGSGATIEQALQVAQDGWQECLRDFGYEINE